jgi:hypothetical protein
LSLVIQDVIIHAGDALPKTHPEPIIFWHATTESKGNFLSNFWQCLSAIEI